ncbi:unnamed protein product [Choristocarpus tenellus]
MLPLTMTPPSKCKFSLVLPPTKRCHRACLFLAPFRSRVSHARGHPVTTSSWMESNLYRPRQSLLSFVRLPLAMIPALRKVLNLITYRWVLILCTSTLSTTLPLRLAGTSVGPLGGASAIESVLTGKQPLDFSKKETVVHDQGATNTFPNVSKIVRDKGDDVVDEAVTLLQKKYIDAGRISSGDWLRMRAEASREVGAAQPKARREEEVSPDPIARGRAEAAAIYNKLKDPYTRMLHPSQLDQVVQQCEGMGIDLGLGIQLHREWLPAMIPELVQQRGSEDTPWRTSTAHIETPATRLPKTTPEPNCFPAVSTSWFTRIKIIDAVFAACVADRVLAHHPAIFNANWISKIRRKDDDSDSFEELHPLCLRRRLTLALTVAFVLTCDSLALQHQPVVVRKVDVGGPAEVAGIRPGDVVLQLGTEAYNKIDIRAANKALDWRGGSDRYALHDGQAVRAVLWRRRVLRGNSRGVGSALEGEPISKKTPAKHDSPMKGLGEPETRVEVEIYPDVKPERTVQWELNQSSRVGVVRILSCSDNTGEELQQAVESMLSTTAKEGGVRGLVLDLRGNGGGSFQASLDVPSVLLPRGKVAVQMKERGKPVRVKRTRGARVKCLDTPLVVLTDHQTASAAEHIAGCLQDHGRALVLGSRTFGKSIAQGVYGLRDGSGATVTVMRVLTPLGRDAGEGGLVPDIPLPWPARVELLEPGKGVWILKYSSNH